jgi:membrane protease YdiL (CAAX protease family)
MNENPFDGSGESSPSDLAPPNPTPPPQAIPGVSQRLHKIFVGEQGLRPGWRVAVYFVLVAAIALLLGQAANHLTPKGKPGSPRLWTQLVGQAIVLIAAFLPALGFARLEKRPFGSYGLPGKAAFGRNFWIGAVWGFAGLSLLLLAIGLSGDFQLGGLAQHGLRLWEFAAFWGVLFLGVSFFEEFLFRGYSLFTLTEPMGFWPAALLLSVIFGALHLGNQGEAAIGAFAAGLIGLFFCLTVRRTGNLWFAVGFHAAWDWGESFFYSVPDSGQMSRGHLLNSSFHGSKWITGGTVGPEGSLWVLAIIAVIWIAFDRTFAK